MSIFEEYGAFNLSLGFKIIQVHHNLAIYLSFCFDSYAPTSGEGVVVGGGSAYCFLCGSCWRRHHTFLSAKYLVN